MWYLQVQLLPKRQTTPYEEEKTKDRRLSCRSRLEHRPPLCQKSVHLPPRDQRGRLRFPRGGKPTMPDSSREARDLCCRAHHVRHKPPHRQCRMVSEVRKHLPPRGRPLSRQGNTRNPFEPRQTRVTNADPRASSRRTLRPTTDRRTRHLQNRRRPTKPQNSRTTNRKRWKKTLRGKILASYPVCKKADATG